MNIAAGGYGRFSFFILISSNSFCNFFLFCDLIHAKNSKTCYHSSNKVEDFIIIFRGKFCFQFQKEISKKSPPSPYPIFWVMGIEHSIHYFVVSIPFFCWNCQTPPIDIFYKTGFMMCTAGMMFEGAKVLNTLGKVNSILELSIKSRNKMKLKGDV